MTDQRTLLADYAANGSEEAFRELVACYINLVYSTAVRLVNGDTHRAEDVTQRCSRIWRGWPGLCPGRSNWAAGCTGVRGMWPRRSCAVSAGVNIVKGRSWKATIFKTHPGGF
jgi:hypothetical protein